MPAQIKGIENRVEYNNNEANRYQQSLNESLDRVQTEAQKQFEDSMNGMHGLRVDLKDVQEDAVHKQNFMKEMKFQIEEIEANMACDR